MKNVVGLITGRRGSGKTSVAQEIVSYERRALVFDPAGDGFGELMPVTRDLDEVHEFLNAVPYERESWALCYTPEYDVGGDAEEFCEVGYDAAHDAGGATLVIDEAYLLFASVGHTPPELGRCLRLGRHVGLNIVLVSPRIAEISRTASFQADWVLCVGAVSEPSDLMALEARTSPDFRRQVEGLGRHGQALWDAVERKSRRVTPEVYGRLLVSGGLQKAGRVAGRVTAAGDLW